MRLDQHIAKKFNITRSQASKSIREGLVTVNGAKITKPAKIINDGDDIRLKSQAQEKLPPTTYHLPPNNIPILYEDSTCLVVNKPSNLTVHPSETTKGETTLIEMFGTDCKLVHRLDKDTTGCLLVAKDAKSLEQLQKQFKDRTVEKTYLAIVKGAPKNKEAVIDAPIGRSLVNRVKMSLFKTSKSREAVTQYKVIGEQNNMSLLECKIKTGRTHQIRVHLSSIGHPIIGDTKYGKTSGPMMLHAWKIVFYSPTTQKKVTVEAPLPQDFEKVLVDNFANTNFNET